MQEWINYVSGPVIGAAIGYFTNYLAVKMLFRPYYKKTIGKWQLPFTPGIIPKRQGDLARAMGNAVGNNLFTSDDLKNALISKDTEDKVIGSIMSKMYSDESIKDILLSITTSDKIIESTAKVSEFITKKLVNTVINIDIKEKIKDLGMNYFNEKRSSLGMLSMFIKDEMVYKILDDISIKIEEYIESNGKELVYPYVEKELMKYMNESLNELTYNLDKNKIYEIIKKGYQLLLNEVLLNLSKNININEIVERKINEMDVKDLEKLCLSVMKKELNAVVNIGALIGFLIGIINIFI